jgi:rubrerythrin
MDYAVWVRKNCKFAETAALGIDDDKKSNDKIILRQAIIAELDAVSLYEQMAASTSNERVKKLMMDISREEKVHVGEFESLLDELDKEHPKAVEEGKEEAKEVE